MSADEASWNSQGDASKAPVVRGSSDTAEDELQSRGSTGREGSRRPIRTDPSTGRSSSSPLEELDERLIGQTIGDGKYHLEALLGAGAMGVVYRARHSELDIPVALKLLNPSLLSLPNIRERFRREAQAASRLKHRNSVQVYDFGVDGELLFIAMEYIDGGSVFELMRGGRLSLERIVALMSQTCAALAAAHDQGIVHRDVKPENVMLARSRDDDGAESDLVKVCDFGIAKIPTREVGESGRMGQASLTQVGEIYGTPNYMSPEQARGERLDGRSDLYSCGVMLYELAVGQPPFEAETPMGLLMQHINSPVPQPRQRAPHIEPELERIILKCLAKQPRDRFDNARDLRAALLALLPNAPAVATPSALPAAPSLQSFALGTSDTLAAVSADALREAAQPRARQTNKGWLLALAILLSAALALGVFMILRDEQASQEQIYALPDEAFLFRAEPVVPQPAVYGARVAVFEVEPFKRAAAAGWAVGGRTSAVGVEASVEGAALVGVSDNPVQPTPEPVRGPRERVKPEQSPQRPSPQSDPQAEQTETVKSVASQAQSAQALGEAGAASDTAGAGSSLDPSSTAVVAAATPEERSEVEQTKPAAVQEAALFVGEARVAIEALQTGGALPKSLVSRELDARVERLEACYQSAAKKAKRDGAQSLAVAFIVDVEGRAGDISVKGATLSGLDACVSAAFSDLRTRRRPDTGTVDVAFSVLFTPKLP